MFSSIIELKILILSKIMSQRSTIMQTKLQKFAAKRISNHAGLKYSLMSVIEFVLPCKV